MSKEFAMPTATVTSKGQITIPLGVRQALGLQPGVRIDFYEIEPGAYAFRPRVDSIMELRGCLAYDGPTITIEEMNQLVIDRAAALDRATMSAAQDSAASDEAA